jgi:LEA14-like dessication related protein
VNLRHTGWNIPTFFVTRLSPLQVCADPRGDRKLHEGKETGTKIHIDNMSKWSDMQSLNEPLVTIEGVKIRALHLSSIDFDVILRIENPNPFGATVREFPFTVFFRSGNKEKEIASGETVTMDIPASNSIEIAVPLTSHDLALFEGLMSLIKQGNIQLKIQGTAAIDHIVGWSLPVTEDIEITEHEITEAVLRKIRGKQAQ